MPRAEVDPLEQLRQRLAGRLSGQTLPDGRSSPYDLKIVTRSPAPTAAARTGTGTGTGTGTARHAGARPGGGAGSSGQAWSYSGAQGPQAWAGLKPEYALCGSGQRQSPIDVTGGLPVALEPLGFAYQPGRFSVVDTGLALQLRPAPGNHLEISGRRFELQHASFHRPGEHRIDGQAHAMSVHLLHKDAEGRLAVVAVQIDEGAALPAAQLLLNHVPLEKGSENPARVLLDPQDLLPADRRHFTYMGSLSTPPCSEGVQWLVMRQPLSASAEQLALLARLYPQNARPVQPLAGRRILQSP